MDEEYKGLLIQRTENGYRIQRKDSSIHCHMKNKQPSIGLIDYVVAKKIPTRVGNYYLSCLVRLSDDTEYCRKVNELIQVRTSKGKKYNYFNHGIKKSF